MLPVQCQIAKVNGAQCGSMAKGFVLTPGDSPMAIYKEATILCARHGEMVQAIMPASQFITIAALRDRMTEEEVRTQRQQSTRDTSATEERPMSTTIAETPVVGMTAVPSAPVDLLALAHRVNGNSADMPRQQTRVIEVPLAPEAPEAPAPVNHGRIKSAEEVEEAALLAQISALKAQADAIKRARIERERAEREAEKDAARLARQQAADPLYAFGQAAELRTQITLHYGSSALQAVETLLEAGVLTVRNGALVVKKLAHDTPDDSASAAPVPKGAREQTPRSAGSRVQYSTEMVGKVGELKAQGKTDRDIESLLHIGVGDGKAAWALRHRRAA